MLVLIKDRDAGIGLPIAIGKAYDGMATFTHRRMVDQLIANEGQYSDDPQVSEIVEYTNQAGAVVWGVTWVNEAPAMQHRYRQATKFVIDPRIIWTAARMPLGAPESQK